MKMTNREKGFSLVELLVVVIIIAIVAAIAIPNLLASRKAANQASAISSLRTIHSAQATYLAVDAGGGGGYCRFLVLLSGAVGMIDETLGNGAKSGYTFTLTAPVAPASIYCVTANPDAGSGDKAYAITQDGVIYRYDTPPTTACDANGAFTLGTGVPIQ